MTKALKTVPDGYTTATPWIITSDTAELIDFVTAAFGGKELARVPNADGGIGHAEIRVGDAVIMGFDTPKGWPETPAFLRLFVADAQAAFERALKAGATEVTKVTPLAFGDAVGRVRDPLGNIWWLQQRLELVAPDEMQKRWADPKWSQPMAYVQDSLTDAMG
jgi:PhnB protein